jgi:hypothetical protein
MKRDFLLAACLLVGGMAGCQCARNVDWEGILIHDVKPWLNWDGKPAPEPVGKELRILGKPGPVRLG